MKPRSMRHGFTILELLVVIGIIVILLALVIPTITRIRATAMAVNCQGHVRTIMQAMLAFAADNDNRFPGNQGTANNNYPPNEQDWLFGNSQGTAATLQLAPQSGTLFPYLNNDYAVYLCPAQQAFAGAGGSGTASFASNGRFDYAIFAVWTGAHVRNIPPAAHMTWPDGHFDTLPTPILVQEAPNEIDGTANVEGCHGNIDLISHAHFGGSYYAAIDGSIQFVIESPGNPNYGGMDGCWVWTAQGPSGQMRTMATSNPGWGWWDTQ